jgi:hypothetical protein
MKYQPMPWAYQQEHGGRRAKIMGLAARIENSEHQKKLVGCMSEAPEGHHREENTTKY